jgi:hypothetical protein
MPHGCDSRSSSPIGISSPHRHAGLWEPYDGRPSRTVLREREGEVPSRYSPGEHDREVSLDGVALAVVDRAGLQVGLGHAEALLDVPELVIAADHEVRGNQGAVRAGGEVGDVAFRPGQVPGLRLELAVDALSRAVQLDEPVPLDRRQARDGLGCLGDLLVDPTQGPQLSGSWTAPGAMPDSTPDINDDRPAVRASRSLASVPAGTRKGVTHHGRERTVRQGPSSAAGCPGR